MFSINNSKLKSGRFNNDDDSNISRTSKSNDNDNQKHLNDRAISAQYKRTKTNSNYSSITNSFLFRRTMLASSPSSFPLSASAIAVVVLLVLFLGNSGHALPVYSNSASLKVASRRLEPLNWSSSNRLFTDLTNSGLNYYLKLDAHLGDSIDLVCPNNKNKHNNGDLASSFLSDAATTSQQPANQAEYSIIYKVGTKYEFDNCIVNPNEAETVRILTCDKPHSENPTTFSIYFVPFSPVPNALEFEEDKEYYFLSTSSGSQDGLTHMAGGLCSKYNMRFSIKISSQRAKQHHQHKEHHHHQQHQHQQQQYKAYNNRNNVSLLSHLFTYDRDNQLESITQPFNSLHDGTRNVASSYEPQRQQPEQLLFNKSLDDDNETSTLSNELGDDAVAKSTQTAQISKLNQMISSANIISSRSSSSSTLSLFLLLISTLIYSRIFNMF